MGWMDLKVRTTWRGSDGQRNLGGSAKSLGAGLGGIVDGLCRDGDDIPRVFDEVKIQGAMLETESESEVVILIHNIWL